MTETKKPRVGGTGLIEGKADQPGVSLNSQPDDTTLAVTVFRSVDADSGQLVHFTQDALTDWLKKRPAAPRKEALPLIKLATFSGSRSNATMVEICGVEGDYDGGVIPLEEAAARMKRAGVKGLVYSTPSHRADNPRWRAWGFLSKPHSPQARYELVSRLNGALGGCLAGESWTASQPFYAGPVKGGAYKVIEVAGEPLDELIRQGRAPEPIGKRAESSTSGPMVSNVAPLGLSGPKIRDYLSWRDPGVGREEWLRVGQAVHHETGGDMVGLLIWNDWSKSAHNYRGFKDLEKCWCSFGNYSGPPVTMRTVITMANAAREEVEAGDPAEDFAAPTPKRRLQLLSASQFEAEFQKALHETWTVHGILLEKVPVVAMYGTPKSGKTFLALDLGLSVASGVDWHGRRVKKQRVVYLAGECGRGLIRRAKAWSVARGVPLDTMDNFHRVSHAVVLDDPQQRRELIEELTRDGEPLGLLIVDTVSRCMVGDENSTADMSRFVRACDELHQRTGATVMLVHHAGKDQSRGMRGSNVLLGAVDLELRVKREGDVTTLEATAARDQEPFEPLRFELRWTDTGHMTDDLENIGAPVPRLLDGPAEKPLSDREQTALDLLTWEAGSSGGSIAISTWRNSVVEALFKDTSKASTRVLFKRIRDELERRKLVIVDGEMVRLPGRVSARKVTTAGIARAILGSELTH